MSNVTDAYVKHALRLIRVANGQNALVAGELRLLSRRIRSAIIASEVSSGGRARLNALIKQLDEIIATSYGRIAAHQGSTVTQLIDSEAIWAASGPYPVAAPATVLQSAKQTFQVLGSTVDEHWERQAANMRARIIAEVRLGIVAKQSEKQIAGRAVGGPAGGGAMEQFRRDARGIVDATTHSAADAGRRTTMKANGINALKWAAILDTKVCISCGERAGKLWTIDGEPVGHSIVYASPVLHPWCRCLLLPMRYPKGIPEDGGPEIDKFENWLEKQTDEQQEDTLGKGRASLWREGKITTSDLIGQDGMVMSLRELRGETPRAAGT